jgi:uncharacterized coiled-coil DUF342 family protein
MENIQTVFNRIQKRRKELKEIRKMYKESLEGDSRYPNINEEISTLRQKKKTVEMEVQEHMGDTYMKLEELRDDIATDQQMLNDIALNMLMDGKTVETTDEYNNHYEPEFKVTLHKSGEIKK